MLTTNEYEIMKMWLSLAHACYAGRVWAERHARSLPDLWVQLFRARGSQILAEDWIIWLYTRVGVVSKREGLKFALHCCDQTGDLFCRDKEVVAAGLDMLQMFLQKNTPPVSWVIGLNDTIGDLVHALHGVPVFENQAERLSMLAVRDLLEHTRSNPLQVPTCTYLESVVLNYLPKLMGNSSSSAVGRREVLKRFMPYLESVPNPFTHGEVDDE